MNEVHVFLRYTAWCSGVKYVKVNRHIKHQVFRGKPQTTSLRTSRDHGNHGITV